MNAEVRYTVNTLFVMNISSGDGCTCATVADVVAWSFQLSLLYEYLHFLASRNIS